MMKVSKESNLGVLCQGQGTQKPGMFKALLSSENEHIRRAAGEVLEGHLKQIKPEIFDIYYNEGIDAARVNSTVNVQPAIAASTMIWHKALEYTVGEKIVPNVGGGYSLGDFVATNMLGVLSDHDTLSLAALRGEVFITIKPGQFYVLTLITKDTAHVTRLNRTLRGGYRVTVRNGPNIVTVAGPVSSRDKLEQIVTRWKQDETVTREIVLDKEVFFVPFHHTRELADVATFFESQVIKYCDRESKARNQHVFLEPHGIFVTNDGRRFTNGTEIMHYLASRHIKNLCDFDRTMRNVGGIASTVIGFGDLNFQRRTALQNGYIQNFVVVNEPGSLQAAARAYEGVLEYRSGQGAIAAEKSRVQKQLHVATS